ncbi:MAG TPA: hypothetical protein VD927_14505 [Chryseosolibacter sp.]|nr:hypothetical protein [Chryseosolibacter sp.]
MNKTWLIVGGVALVMLLLVIRLFVSQDNRMNEEREWFSRELRYEFSAQVDSVRMFNEETGRLWCRITAGDPQVHREDSLKPFFKDHDKLYLIFHKAADSIIFLVPNGNLVAKGDSVRVSSQQNTIQFFRNGERVATDELSNTLTGFGIPFFLRKKE